MHFGSLPVEILSLILPSHGKGACVAAQVCSSWRAFVQSQLLQVVAADRSLPMWCRRWQIADRSEANFAFATLCRINPHLLRFADVYDADDVLLSELDHKTLDVANHIQLGHPVGDNSFQFFTAGTFPSNSKCWKNLALFEFFFGDDLQRIESWWMLVETRLNAKQHGAFVLHSLNFGSTWQNLYNHAPLLSPEACFLYLFHNGQLHGPTHPTRRPTSCQAQPWHRSLVQSMPDSSPDVEGFSPQMFSGLFGSYGVYNIFVSSTFLPLEDAAAHAMSMKFFDSPASLVLSFSEITGQPCRQLVMFQNGNLMASSYQLNGQRFRRKYFRLSFPEDPDSPEYRGAAVASSANSDLYRMLCHYSEQLSVMCCSPAPHSIEELESNSDLNFGLTLHGTFPDSFSSATSNRIRVTVSTLLMHDNPTPEARLAFNADGTINDEASKFMYTYKISIQMIEPGPDLQLCRRRWVSQVFGQEAQVIEGEGVVGYHPILRYGEPAFVYQSQTSAAVNYSFSGAFLFAPPGTPFRAAASMTEVTVPKFKFSRFGHLW